MPRAKEIVGDGGSAGSWRAHAARGVRHERSGPDLDGNAGDVRPETIQLAAGASGPGAQPETIDDTYRRYEGYVDDLRELGANVAADAMRRYLDKTGGVMQVAPEDLRNAPVVQQVQEGIHQHFKSWMTHRTQEVPSPPGAKVPGNRGWPWEGIASDLRNLKDGETIHRASSWDKKFDYPEVSGILESFAPESLSEDAKVFGFAGKADLNTDGGFEFTRRGNEIIFEGTLLHKFYEPYDFEDWTPLPIPKKGRWIPRLRTGGEARRLATEGRAANFDMASHWTQRVRGKIAIGPNGRLRVIEFVPTSDVARPADRSE